MSIEMTPAPEGIPPAQANEPAVTGHEYDGIREYDNPTPGWWVALFIGSVIFAVLYTMYYNAPVPDRSIYDRLEEAKAENLKKKFGKMLTGAGEMDLTEANMLKWMATPDAIAIGQSSFKQNCVRCHGSDGQGLVGPNLTDDVYKNVKVLLDVEKVIANGAGNGNMPPWATGSSALHPVELRFVAAYVASLRGKNLPSSLPALGEKIPPWPPLPVIAPASGTAPGTWQ